MIVKATHHKYLFAQDRINNILYTVCFISDKDFDATRTGV